MDEALARAFEVYASAFPGEAETVDLFRRFLDSSAHAFERTHPVGHFTGSAWLVSADGERVLLTHHRKLDRWLQLGGHADGAADLAAVALREAEEESGLRGLAEEQAIFDLDRHRIPVRANEAEHWHYDVRYVVRALDSEEFEVGAESHALAWREIAAIADDTAIDASLQRMARKWLVRDARQFEQERASPCA